MILKRKKRLTSVFHRLCLKFMANQPCNHQFDHMHQRIMHIRNLGFNPLTILDIGASDGRWTTECMKIFPQSNYFLVDPLDENHHSLLELVVLHKNLKYWKGCLGANSGVCCLNVDGPGSSILRGHTGNTYGIQREVPVETLDNLINLGICSLPNLIKIDVQGYELEVLKGAERALLTTDAIILEISFFPFQDMMPIFHEVVSELADYGYIVYDILSLSLRPLDNAAGQTDILFLKSDHSLLKDIHWDKDSIY